MDKLSQFFTKVKKDSKFKKAGPGQSLSGGPAPRPAPQSRGPAPRHTPAPSAHAAGQAALARQGRAAAQGAADVDWQARAMKAQARKEQERAAEQQQLERRYEGQAVSHERPAASPERESGSERVMFTSPLNEEEVGTYQDIQASISSTLHSTLDNPDYRVETACLIIQTCNASQQQVQTCVDTLNKMLGNIVDNPDVEKFRKIRQSNKTYATKIQPIEGAEHFLAATGFEVQHLPHEDAPTPFWVFPPSADPDLLPALLSALCSAQPVRPALARSARVFPPTRPAPLPALPEDFFKISREELHKEQKARENTVEQAMMLRTEEMRSRDITRPQRTYRFTYVRIRFPSGHVLQGTFHVWERLADVRSFVAQHLSTEWRPFCLGGVGTQGMFTEDQESHTLSALSLVPTSMLAFSWDTGLDADGLDDTALLSEEALANLQICD